MVQILGEAYIHDRIDGKAVQMQNECARWEAVPSLDLNYVHVC